MCDRCLENKATETHKETSYCDGLFNLCKDCAIISGFRTISWYQENEEMVASKYGIDWKDI